MYHAMYYYAKLKSIFKVVLLLYYLTRCSHWEWGFWRMSHDLENWHILDEKGRKLNYELLILTSYYSLWLYAYLYFLNCNEISWHLLKRKKRFISKISVTISFFPCLSPSYTHTHFFMSLFYRHPCLVSQNDLQRLIWLLSKAYPLQTVYHTKYGAVVFFLLKSLSSL